ncbi:hypothetical protein SAMN05216251_12726 [Actinacidiphila alni]|uniref:Uncharacterized protein n=1 Tax=Actinacidiphila alni TaxID=380248 RepID=A0A1I2LCH3_9ACTN|nr:hypothetical protein [Actinacidiphila alni]SFF74776.1 hypothetical protein SAMN05216251_12726 [Actinacidiphila alni]
MTDTNGNDKAMTGNQQEQLAEFAAKRAARLAVAAGAQDHADLAAQLQEMDATFASDPDRDNPLRQENHELRREIAVLTAALHAALTGTISLPAA